MPRRLLVVGIDRCCGCNHRNTQLSHHCIITIDVRFSCRSSSRSSSSNAVSVITSQLSWQPLVVVKVLQLPISSFFSHRTVNIQLHRFV